MTLSGIVVSSENLEKGVLIPLLVDDPLWDVNLLCKVWRSWVLIPLLVDDPLWAFKFFIMKSFKDLVLIPLLVDDPLWDITDILQDCKCESLNPSFSGWHSLG